MAEGKVWLVGQKLRIWFKKKKCCLELEKMHSEILGTMESTQRQIFDPAVKRCNRLPQVYIWQGRKIYQSFENSTWPVGKKRTTAERNKNKIFREIRSEPPTVDKAVLERNGSTAFGVPKVIQCQN